MKQKQTQSKSPINNDRKLEAAKTPLRHTRQGSYSGTFLNDTYKSKHFKQLNFKRMASSNERKEENQKQIQENYQNQVQQQLQLQYQQQFAKRQNLLQNDQLQILGDKPVEVSKFSKEDDSLQFQKNRSEADFLNKDSAQRKQNLMGAKYQNKIQLLVRIRPFLQTESYQECLKVMNDNGIRLYKEYHQIHFKFDTILLPKDAQDQVYKKVQGIVKKFLMGINGTIFAYGQTGAGKTYSIIGSDAKETNLINNQRKGILPRSLDQVFQIYEQQQMTDIGYEEHQENANQTKFYISFYEIYNEKIFDLLSSNSSVQNQKQKDFNFYQQQQQQQQMNQQQINRQNLELREEKDGQFSVVDLRKIQVQHLQEAYQWLEKGLLKRATSSTSLNNNSSRSHSIFQIYMEKINEEGVLIKSKLRIVDLAGSEKYSLKRDLPQSEKNLKIQELTSINSSLSALGQCISALADPARKHIPYRNSKLTKVLKDSLDENSNVALVICVSPSVDSYKETFSTLQFADRAKKAILDGRNFSDSKLLAEQQIQGPQALEFNNLVKLYQEEKAIRKELEKFMHQNQCQDDVLLEMERLKQQNKELQDRVIELQKSQQKLKPLKSCFRTNFDKIEKKQTSEGDASDDENTKRVRFAQKLDNDQSLDSDDRERIEHNLKYNDDTIFDNISIFRDVNDSGLVLLPRKMNQKDVHPLKLKQQLPISDDSEDEEEEKKDVVKEESEESKIIQLEKIENYPDEEMKNEEEEEDQFWDNIKNISASNNNLQLTNIITKGKVGVSPIQKKATSKYDNNLAVNNNNNYNNSSQDISKDLIELQNENQFNKLIQNNSENDNQYSEEYNKKYQQSNQNYQNNQQEHKFSFFDDERQQSIGQVQDMTLEVEEDQLQQNLQFQVDDTDSAVLQNNSPLNKINQEQSFDMEFEAENQLQKKLLNYSKQVEEQQVLLSDSMIIDVIMEEAGNLSQENQNTLLLDSQSIIMEVGEGNQNLQMSQKDNPIGSQMMLALEASCIVQQPPTPTLRNNSDSKEIQINWNQQQQQVNQQQIQQQQQNQPNIYYSQNMQLFNNNIFQSSSNATSSQMNTDILTYSLTNTYTTIESLNDELSAIRNGLESSQKRGAPNILKVIQKYAREIEQIQENVKEEEKIEQSRKQIEEEENVNSNEDSVMKEEVEISQIEEESNENQNFVKDIKSYYNKIHSEIGQLKGLLMENNNNNNVESKELLSGGDSPIINSRKHMLSEKVPQKNRGALVNSQSQVFNKDFIDNTQVLINEIKKEMHEILNMNQSQNNNIVNGNQQQSQPLKNYNQIQSLTTQNQREQALINQKYLKSSNLQLKQNILQQQNQNFQRNSQQNQQQTRNNEQQRSCSNKRKQKMSQFLVGGSYTIQDKSINDSRKSMFSLPQTKSQINIPNSLTPISQSRFIHEQNGEHMSSQLTLNKGKSFPEQTSPQVRNKDQNFENNQKTPEVFKSLSKYSNINNQEQSQLESSEQINNKYAKMFHQPSNYNSIRQNSQQEMNQIQYLNIMEQPTKPLQDIMEASDIKGGENFFDSQQDFQITMRNNNNVNNSINQQEKSEMLLLQDLLNNNNEKKKKGDNTLTLIFDSEDEEVEEQVNESIQKIAEIDDYFNEKDTSKIDNRGSFQVSNSFQGENSILFMNENKPVNDFQPILQNLRTDSLRHNPLSNNQNNLSVRENIGMDLQEQNENSIQIHKKVQMNVYKRNTDFEKIQAQNAKQNEFFNQQTMDVVEDEEQTSKKSVQKYWNQYFNKTSQPNVSQQQNISRNMPNFMPQSLTNYQSSSFKEGLANNQAESKSNFNPVQSQNDKAESNWGKNKSQGGNSLNKQRNFLK